MVGKVVKMAGRVWSGVKKMANFAKNAFDKIKKLYNKAGREEAGESAPGHALQP